MMATPSPNLGPKSTLRKLQVNVGDPNTDIPSVGSGCHAAIWQDKYHHDFFTQHINVWLSLHLLKLAPTNSQFYSILFSLLYPHPDSRSFDLFTPSIPKCGFSRSSFLWHWPVGPYPTSWFALLPVLAPPITVRGRSPALLQHQPLLSVNQTVRAFKRLLRLLYQPMLAPVQVVIPNILCAVQYSNFQDRLGSL
jgi:hypothetical protein